MIGFTPTNGPKRATQLKERYVKHLRIDDTRTLYEIYDFKEEIGHGSYGTVISAVEKQSAITYAIKIVNKFTAGTKKLQEVYGEINILKSVAHPNIIHLEKVYESPRKIYMVLERCSDNLFADFKLKQPFTEKLTKKIIKQLASAVYYLHKNDIVHRDIKMENILLATNPDDPFDEYYIKLSDFGLSIVKAGAGIRSMLNEHCGTIIYMPPEILLQHSYSELCDIWATGIMIYLMLYGTYPFFSTDEDELTKQICNSDLEFPSVGISYEATDLIKSVLQKDPVKRITALEVLQHPWLLDIKIKERRDANVLDYMKKWRSEMQLPTGEESDWISAVVELDTSCSDVNMITAKKKNAKKEVS